MVALAGLMLKHWQLQLSWHQLRRRMNSSKPFYHLLTEYRACNQCRGGNFLVQPIFIYHPSGARAARVLWEVGRRQGPLA